MNLQNNLIYKQARLLQTFNTCNMKLPIKINFYLQKNIQLIAQAATEIENARLLIAQQYGTINEIVNKELNDLLNLEQDLNIHIFKLSDFDNIELTYQQMSAIMFMIEED